MSAFGREMCENAQLCQPHPELQRRTVAITQVMIEGVNCYWFTPEDPSPDKIIIYLHGGGFAAGSIRTHGNMVSHFAKELHAETLFIENALAPEKYSNYTSRCPTLSC
jgi:acetyl esterase/lipase